MNDANAKTGVRGDAMARVTARQIDPQLGQHGTNHNLNH